MTDRIRPWHRRFAFLKHEQEQDGSWYGRWGVNYIYGTWSVLAGLRAIGEDLSQPYIRSAVTWLESRQNPDGGWGESCCPMEIRPSPAKAIALRRKRPGPSWTHVGRHVGLIQRGERHSLPASPSDEGRFVGRGAAYRYRVPPSVLPSLSLVLSVLSHYGHSRCIVICERAAECEPTKCGIKC